MTKYAPLILIFLLLPPPLVLAMPVFKLPSIGHLLKTLTLGLGSNIFDVYSDVGTGLRHLEVKYVTRTIQILPNSTIPENCFPLDKNSSLTDLVTTSITSTAQGVICEEQDIIWAATTFSLIHLPGVVLYLCLVAAMLQNIRRGNFSKYWDKKSLAAAHLFLFVPYPILVFIQQIISIFILTDQMEVISAIFLFGEGSLEASPQVLLLMFIILGDHERDVTWVEYASIVSSIFTIAKTSIEMFASESYRYVTKNKIIHHKGNCNDSLLHEKESIWGKLWLMCQISPAFITSLVFRVCSLAIITTLLRLAFIGQVYFTHFLV